MSWRQGHPFFGHGNDEKEEEVSLSPSSSRSDSHTDNHTNESSSLSNKNSTARRSRKFSHRMRFLQKRRTNASSRNNSKPQLDASITDEAYDPSSMSMGSSSATSNSSSSNNIGESYSSDAFSPRSLLPSGTTSGDEDEDDVTESLEW